MPTSQSLTPVGYVSTSEYYMALSSSVRAPISRRTSGLDFFEDGRGPLLLWGAFVTLVVAAPWLVPGYLFGTDWPGPRHFALPTALVSSAPVEVALAAVAWVAGGEATGKLFLLGLLFAGVVLAYKALPAGGFVPRAAASTLYIVNPFVYGRLHYGQLLLLGAYAVLPLALVTVRRLLIDPGLRRTLWVAGAFFLVGVFSPHLLLMAGLLAVALYVAHVVALKARLEYLRESAMWVVASVAVATVGSSYWLLPLIAGRGSEGAIIASTGSGQLSAYAAVPDLTLGLLPNLMGLYGFWAEHTGRFTSMKAFVPFWPLVLAAILAVATVGVVGSFRRQSRQLAPWVAGLLVAGVIALMLEMGISHPVTTGLVRWLDAHLVLYRGLRDAGKWAALLALVYSQLVGLGAAALLDLLRTGIRSVTRSDWSIGSATALLLALPLYYGNGLLFGAHGEIKPSQYPQGWYAADRLLASDRHPGQTLVLPWHEYMSYSFIQNQNKVVASPAPSFFSVPVLVSANPEVAGIAAPTDPDQVAISSLVGAGNKGDWAQALAAHGVKYVLLAREFDWRSYAFLDSQPGLAKVGDFGSIVVFCNSFSP